MPRHQVNDLSTAPTPSPAPSPASAAAASAPVGELIGTSKACDSCRIKKVRCDRKTPCANCKQRNTLCTKSPRVARPKRQQDSTSARYVQKIRHLERQLQLARTDRSANITASDLVPHRLHDPDLGASPNSASSSASVDGQSSTTLLAGVAGTCQNQPSIRSAGQTQSSPHGVTEQRDEAGVLLEGPTSLSAHSTMAIGFLGKIAGADAQGQYSMETQELLVSLRQIVKAIKTQHAFPRDVPNSNRQSWQQKPEGLNMPPIHASVAAIRNVQEKQDVTFLFLTTLLPSRTLSDICLRVYFSDDYSDADFIILNVALCYFFDEPDISPSDPVPPSTLAEYKSICQANLETAISRLTLHIIPSHEMIMALMLAAIYSVEIVKPHWAWTLVTSAYQASYALGYHLGRPSSAEGWCDTSNPCGLMFWVIYFLEKTLCLRLGRCSTIPDSEITVMLPGGSPGLDYSRSMVKLARVAGKLYEKLYGAQALAAFRAGGRVPVEELSQELDVISSKSQESIQAWRARTTDSDWRILIDFLSASDMVLLHSMQTLIHRAASAHSCSSTSFTEECIASARKALACHQSCPVVLAGAPSGFLASYMSWFIFFRPFIPFIVLFCHVVETGDRGDLQRMKQFADSMRSVNPSDADAAMRHRRLFQVFHDVALRYVELKAVSSAASHDGNGMPFADGGEHNGEASHEFRDEVSNEIDNCLSAIGLNPSLGTSEGNVAYPFPSLGGPMPAVAPDGSEIQLGPGMGRELAPHFPYWFQATQQMMGLMDNHELFF